jgi:hypothetical protein
VLDAHIYEDNESDHSDDLPKFVKKETNMDVLIPHKDNKDVPDFLLDFIENDPNFIPEIHCNNLEDVFMNLHRDENNIITETYSKANQQYNDYFGLLKKSKQPDSVISDENSSVSFLKYKSEDENKMKTN